MICVKNYINSTVCNISDLSVEHLFVHLISYKIIICAVYLPPTSPPISYKKHAKIVKYITDKYFDCKIIIVGDFNIRGVNWSSTTPLTCSFTEKADGRAFEASDIIRDYFSYCELLQYFLPHPSKGYCLDLLFCNFDNPIISINPDSLLPVDTHHLSYIIKFPVTEKILNQNCEKKNFYLANYNEINNELLEIDWSSLLNITNVNIMCSKFYDVNIT